MTLTGFS